ncbi:MAG: response regulator [Spirochaetales bacterium]|nr:response regulator [Spirochaetales bacterium]
MPLPERIYKAAFEQARQPIIVLNEQGIPAVWNEAFEELFLELAGFVPDKLPVPLFDWLEERDSFQYSYYVTEILLGRMGAATVESGVRGMSGRRLWLRTTLSPLRTENQDRTERWIWCSFQDVTDQKIREHDLVSAKEEAEKATLTKSQFLANMSHEIRTPIQTILGMTELLTDTGLDKEQMDYIRTVRFSADVLLGLINDILDFSKIEAGKLDLETADFDFRDLLRQSVELIILDAHKKGLEVILDTDDSLPRVVRGDPGRLRQIVVNLFKNAVKFTREGEIVVRARKRGDGQRPTLAIAVLDSGDGVAEAVRPRLFTPFTQGGSYLVTQGGTGLGLAISRYLVEVMGGSIWYEPNAPRGSVFAFEIPLIQAEYSLPPHGRDLHAPARVLVVDDHALALEHGVRMAASYGLLADGARSGDDALLALRRAAEAGKPYAVCLIDQNMPGMDGWRLAAEITADRLINATRLVLLAPEGAIGPEAKMKLLQWFNGYAAKPLDPDELFQVLKLALSDDVDLPPAGDGQEAPRPPEEPDFGLSVLIAEDHVVNQELFRTLLEKAGCTVTVANDGAEALDMYGRGTYDLVLMDIFMPNMDGYQAARALRERGCTQPIIAVTASAVKGERDKCIAVGMNDVLVKPFKRKDLETMLGFWGNKVSSSREPEQSAAPVSERHLWDSGVFDFAGLVDTFLGKRDTVVDLLGRFTAKLQGQLLDIEAAVAASDAKTVRETAHSIKGAAWNLTAKALGDAAKTVEEAGRDSDMAAAQSSLSALKERSEEFRSCAQYYTGLFGPGAPDQR